MPRCRACPVCPTAEGHSQRSRADRLRVGERKIDSSRAQAQFEARRLTAQRVNGLERFEEISTRLSELKALEFAQGCREIDCERALGVSGSFGFKVL